MVRMYYVVVREQPSAVVQEGEAPEHQAVAAVNNVISRGISMGKVAVNQVKQFDEKHGLSATAVATASTVDQKLGVSEGLSAASSAVNEQVRTMDEKYQVSEKFKSAYAVADEKAKFAGSIIKRNILTGASRVTGALSKMAKAADDAVKTAKQRATGADVAGNEEPYHGNNTSRSIVDNVAISSISAAGPRVYMYDPHGSLLGVVGT